MPPEMQPLSDALEQKALPKPDNTEASTLGASSSETAKLEEKVKALEEQLAALDDKIAKLSAKKELAERVTLFNQSLAEDFGPEAQAKMVEGLHVAANYVEQLVNVVKKFR